MRDYFQDLRERILKDLGNVLSDGLKIFYKNEKCKKALVYEIMKQKLI